MIGCDLPEPTSVSQSGCSAQASGRRKSGSTKVSVWNSCVSLRCSNDTSTSPCASSLPLFLYRIELEEFCKAVVGWDSGTWG